MKPTPVIFRTWEASGECIAFFPTIPATVNPAPYCLSYERIGQHGQACAEILPGTRPAFAHEWQPLQAELESIGYKVKRITRFTVAHVRARIKALES